jgi:hypothetical protein
LNRFISIKYPKMHTTDEKTLSCATNEKTLSRIVILLGCARSLSMAALNAMDLFGRCRTLLELMPLNAMDVSLPMLRFKLLVVMERICALLSKVDDTTAGTLRTEHFDTLFGISKISDVATLNACEGRFMWYVRSCTALASLRAAVVSKSHERDYAAEYNRLAVAQVAFILTLAPAPPVLVNTVTIGGSAATQL